MSYIIFLLPIAAIILMFRSQKKRQQQAQSMQSAMVEGSGVRTIGGLYATVKSINDSTVGLEIAPGVVTHFAKSAVAAVIDPQEYDEIINGRPAEDEPVDGVATESVEDAVDEAGLDTAGSEKPATK
ncbi:preprotein translocase subunit YajC [Streptomyces tateyamensis]|uniref:Preprotein translocase subunit YajC n=1 Tax=Streptomyces tateyamensis TaxID=565073 RepID=A0A2V4MXX7_9ACTN|nr:preprotein translocase subunit YajC [Streptomyces tateyamensis]PYC76325.1 preprotein translocase subunit YajC [Streptomyces tateyamensis]